MPDPATVDRELRHLLAGLLDLPPATVDALPADTPLFDGPLGLSSLTGARLLDAVTDRFGVDVAAEDLSLSSLETLATLADFVAARVTVEG